MPKPKPPKPPSDTCGCRLCVRSRDWQARKNSDDIQVVRQLVDEIENALAETEFELDLLQNRGKWGME